MEEANTREWREPPQTKGGRCTTADQSGLLQPHFPGNEDPGVNHAPCTTHSCSECSPGHVPGPDLTTAVHSTHSEALQHLNYSESFQNKVPVNQNFSLEFFFFFSIKGAEKINVMPRVTGTHVLLLSYAGEVLVPWGAFTLRAIVLKAQVSKGSTLGTGSLLPTGYLQPGLTS